MGTQRGSTKEFDSNWVARPESHRIHWRKGKPRNQIEFAFRQHFEFIKEVVGLPKKGAVLDVGAGRGSMSAYFVEDGYDVTLLDSSKYVLDVAQGIFASNHHPASFVCGDALHMPFDDGSFDVVVSIGLLEHFKDITLPIQEQLRVLKPGGVFVAYIIPKRSDNVQALFQPLNDALKKFAFVFDSGSKKDLKRRVYRNSYGSNEYVRFLKKLRKVYDVTTSGV